MQENELLEILNPPSNYYARSLLNKIKNHFNHPNGDYYRKEEKLLEKVDSKKMKIFVVDEKDQY